MGQSNVLWIILFKAQIPKFLLSKSHQLFMLVDRVFLRKYGWRKMKADYWLVRTDQLVKFGDVPINGLGDCFIMWKLSPTEKVKDLSPVPSSEKSDIILISVHPFPSLSKLAASSVCLI